MPVHTAVCNNHNSQFGPEEKNVFSKEAIRYPGRMNIPPGEYHEMKYSIYICIEILL